MDIIRPAALKKGDAVGIVAPASPFDTSLFEKGIDKLSAYGFIPIFSNNIFQKAGYLAGADAHRAALLDSYFKDPNIKAIWCVRGGYGSLRILSRLDYPAITENPKLLVGCSDITALLNTIHYRCGLVTIHGPMVASLSQADSATMESVLKCLTMTQSTTIKTTDGKIIHSGVSCGPVAGGNLATLCHLLGTPFAPDFKDRIIFLEDTGERPYRIDRMLSQMKLAGCFETVAGICLGSFENCGDISVIHQIVEDIFSNISVPILGGFPIGHGLPNLTLPIGLHARLDTDAGTLTYLAPAVGP